MFFDDGMKDRAAAQVNAHLGEFSRAYKDCFGELPSDNPATDTERNAVTGGRRFFGGPASSLWLERHRSDRPGFPRPAHGL